MNVDRPHPRPDPAPRRARRLLVLSATAALVALGGHATASLAEARHHDVGHSVVTDAPGRTPPADPGPVAVTVPHHITAMTIEHLHVPDTRGLLRRDDRL